VLNVTKRKYVDSTQIEHETGDLFGQCLQAFHAFSDLQELSENMRVLSLNAELAAGRAGEKGVAVRALTQYTRELVNRLNSVTAEMTKLKGQMYAHSASAIRVLRQNTMLERAGQALQSSTTDSVGIRDALVKVADVKEAYLKTTLDQVQQMIECVNKLDSVGENVSGVGSQAASISTNIAIEAALSGQFEGEFRQVATAMQEYVDQLRNMAEEASRAIRDAVSIGQDLHVRARDKLHAAS